MISWGETGADASSTLPPNFGPATVAIDQTTATAAMATIAVTMMSLRISYHPCIVMSCAIVLAHRALRQREALHTGAKFYSETCRLEPASIPSDLAMVASPAVVALGRAVET